MVQYFRNYIGRPVGSMSATSTVDSLSSSFICNANEANTMVPPPYSRAASPDRPHTMHDYPLSTMPRSASQHACSTEHQPLRLHNQLKYRASTQVSLSNDSNNDIEHMLLYHRPFGTPNSEQNEVTSVTADSGVINFSHTSDESNLQYARTNCNENMMNNLDTDNTHDSMANRNGDRLANRNINVSHSAQHFKYGLDKSNSNSSVPNSSDVITNAQTNSSDMTVIAICEYAGTKGSTNADSQHRSIDIDGDDASMAADLPGSSSTRQHILSGNLSEESPVNADILKKFGTMRSYINSTVSSLANIGSPSSPPLATSPTDEVKELLENIRRLHNSADHSRNDEFEMQRRSDATTFSSDSIDAYDGDGDESSTSNGIINIQPSKKRPSTLQQYRRINHRPRFFPISAAKNLRSPIGSSSGILGFGRGRKSWISKSAPTTPGTAMPSCFLNDDSPLLDEYDEDAEEAIKTHKH